MSHDDHEVLRRVQAVLGEQLGLESGSQVPPDADFYAELGGDSLDLAEITMSLEEEFDIVVPDKAVPAPVTARKMAAMAAECLAARASARVG